jgi:uncharacterized membrane protein YphA (DoxX/SURF4 family)
MERVTTSNFQQQNLIVSLSSFFKTKQRAIVEIICFLFILLFVYAAVSKLLDYQSFRVELGKSPLLTKIADWIAWFIPVIEIVISIMLAIRNLRLIGLYMAFSLMTLFTTYLIAILQFSFFVPCTCGGVLQALDWDTHIVFNCVFIIFAMTGVYLHSNAV